MTKWVRIEHEGKATYGQLKGDTINLCTGSPFENNTMNGESVRLDHAKLLSPVEPRQFLGLWNNFHERRVADDLFMPKSPLFFVKLASCVSANDDTISRPTGYTNDLKFEAELGIVIGKPTFQITSADADDHIFGYTCVNDVTAPTTLFEESGFTHWCRAKSFPTFGPIGPVIETDIEADGLTVKAIVNGTEKQNYPVSDMIFKPREIVSMISQEIQLLPGDVIACGTSTGADIMQPGETVEIVIDGIGRLSNRYDG
ncbi:fumarylacetoacetate hydrolase family protein [Solemya velum gill symbiont]|uniref:2-hydroxyhepta-2,4-diene-1,7-dioate isomerase n=1 Tax=Solemya velum gill symbiont TaxID=2340 RepID=A0A1T2IRP1_SOVGS|nr:fumarylacetoacetate hydrolase family protein [Solemya velum gill symbiont]OOY36122.1 hypothetical protein BOV88_00530 [Solemya velum gill symbiont]OOY38172.1 hypothetical protein BOV89_03550 [Solemya velum gill symbiont]OOY39972.1 hypothetical protein BOV90_06500 [Solemya velum gill symbiont]OOY48744.1 hypothetical protein BOV93_01200 [Solemya velum gill symbiont]OOY53080.1 hypothetical protein BOV94_01455 [Solemya velum gill symbiont]